MIHRILNDVVLFPLKFVLKMGINTNSIAGVFYSTAHLTFLWKSNVTIGDFFYLSKLEISKKW